MNIKIDLRWKREVEDHCKIEKVALRLLIYVYDNCKVKKVSLQVER